jgi:flagellar protein FliO/FliZ
MRVASSLAAIAVALAVTGLTPSAVADEPPPPAGETATPLALRPSRPLALGQAPTHASIGWKVLAACVALAGTAFWLRRKSQPLGTGAPAAHASLEVIRRTSVGFRSELLIVDVEGQRLLLGVTPHSIQSLAVLDGDASPDAEATAAAAGPSVGEKFSAMLSTAERRSAAREAAESPQGPTPGDDGEVAGQARGLLALRAKR